jgi:hypothetical protein
MTLANYKQTSGNFNSIAGRPGGMARDADREKKGFAVFPASFI